MLYSHQEEFVRRNPPKHMLLWETGTGKTIAAIEWAKKNGGPVLVVCPKMLRETWHRATEQHGTDIQWTIISKETMRKDHAKLPKHRCLIMDEAHNLAGHTSQMHKAMVSYIQRCRIPYILGLTATPYSQPWNVFAIAALMGRQMNWYNFKKTFFHDIKMGHRMIPVAKPHMDGALIDILKIFGSTKKLSECIDMPESIYETEHFQLTTDQHKRITDAYDVQPTTRFTREHQICGGTLKGDEYEQPVSFDCPKLDRLIELVKENPRTIVVCRYLYEMEVLAARLSQIRPTFTISGQVKDRDGLVQSLKAMDSYALIAQAQCSEGWELSDCPMMIFYSMSWRFVDRVQMEGRIRRINNPKRNVYISLTVQDSADEAVYDAISKRQDFQAELYAHEGKRLPDETHPVGKAQP